MCVCSVCVCVEREIHGINHFKWSAEIILGYGCGEKEKPTFTFFFKILFICLTERVREHKQGEQQREREKQAPHWAKSPMRDSIPGPWNHDLSQRQTLNSLCHPGAPHLHFKQ